MERADRSVTTDPGDWYPLRLTSTIRALVYGGRAITERLGRTGLPAWSIAESWEVLDTDGSISFITNGRFSGASLRELLHAHPAELMGHITTADGFPLCVQLVDATGPTPLRLTASPNAGSAAPASIWHVLDAPPGATAVCGVNEGADPDALHRALVDQELDGLLREVPVRPGNTLVIPNGTLYRFGPHTMLYAVTPQSVRHHSPSRWRDEDGSWIGYGEWKREIDAVVHHCDLASRPVLRPGSALRSDADATETLLHADRHRAVERWQVAATAAVTHRVRTAVLLTNVGGPVSFNAGGIEQSLEAGRTVLVPAALEELTVCGTADVVVSYVPDMERDLHVTSPAAAFESAPPSPRPRGA